MKNTRAFKYFEEKGELAPSAKEQQQNPGVHCFIPVAELFNHNDELGNDFDLDVADKGVFTTSANWDMARGAEVFLRYKAVSSISQLYFVYGFVSMASIVLLPNMEVLYPDSRLPSVCLEMVRVGCLLFLCLPVVHSTCL